MASEAGVTSEVGVANGANGANGASVALAEKASQLYLLLQEEKLLQLSSSSALL